MTDFPLNAKIPSTISEPSNHAVLEARFGDGYSQRAADGINTNRRIFSLRWTALTQAEASVISDFLSAQDGYKVFNWMHPVTTVVYQVACRRYSRQYQDSVISSISAEFEQEFDLQ
jgi:phage-related protein